MVWEGFCLDPPVLLQLMRGKLSGGGVLPFQDNVSVAFYKYTLMIRSENSRDAILARIKPEYLYPNGFSIIDGRDRDGFDRAGLDKDGFDRLGWNRQGVNSSGERWSGRVAGGRQGPGVLSMPDGASYVGAYRDDLRDGWGALLGPEGGEVQFWDKGALKESFPLGGKILSPVREWIFLGRAVKGVLVEGKGRAISADGAWRIPEGTFRGGRLVEGTMEGSDGTLYVGRFENDQLVQGTIRGASGWTYTGGLADGKPEGRGIVLLPDGTRYEGEFKDGTYDGQGVLSRPDGEKFEGTFRDGKPHGIGIYFNGETVERCEYYDGKRIDQAFLIKQENEKQLEALRQEREKLAKEKADQAEMARLAAERAAAEQQAQDSKSSNKLIAGIFGVGAALAGGSVGMSGAEAALFGAKVAGDVAKGDASMSGSKSTAQAIADSRTGGAGAAGAPGTAGSGTPGSGAASAVSPEKKAARRTPLTFRGNTNPDVTIQIKSDYFGLYEYADGSQFQLNPDGGGWIKYSSGKERLSIEWGVQLSTDGTIKESSGFMLLYVIAAPGTSQEKAELLELGTDRGVIRASGWTKK